MRHEQKMNPGRDLAQSKNAFVLPFIKNNWVEKGTENSKTGEQALIDSYRGGCFNGHKFRESDEFKALNNSGTPDPKKGGSCDRALQSFLKRVFFPQNMNEVDFQSAYEKIQKYHHQAVWGFGPYAVGCALDPNWSYNDEHSNRFNNLIMGEKGEIILDTGVSDFKLLNHRTDLVTLPGSIHAQYLLTENGFELTEVTVSNSLLKEIIMSEHVDLTPEKLAKAAQEEVENAFDKTFESLHKQLTAIRWPNEKRKLGFQFLEETATLASKATDSSTFENLTLAMHSVSELLDAKTPLQKDVALQKIAASYSKLNQAPWSRTLSTLLWNLASAILAAGSVLATSTGIGAPIGLGLGIAAAATSIYGTGASLFAPTPLAKVYDQLQKTAAPLVKVAT